MMDGWSYLATVRIRGQSDTERCCFLYATLHTKIELNCREPRHQMRWMRGDWCYSLWYVWWYWKMASSEQKEGERHIWIYRVPTVFRPGHQSLWCVFWDRSQECQGFAEASRSHRSCPENAAWAVATRQAFMLISHQIIWVSNISPLLKILKSAVEGLWDDFFCSK